MACIPGIGSRQLHACRRDVVFSQHVRFFPGRQGLGILEVLKELPGNLREVRFVLHAVTIRNRQPELVPVLLDAQSVESGLKGVDLPAQPGEHFVLERRGVRNFVPRNFAT